MNYAYQKLGALPNGIPSHLDDSFYCERNSLTSLKGGPTSVTGDYWCQRQRFKLSLEGGPISVGKEFWCSENKMTSLEFGPTLVDRNYICTDNPLRSIIGLAKKIGGDLYLPDIIIRDLWKLPYLSHIGGNIKLNEKINSILNKYKNGGKQAAFQLQQELIEIGYL